MARSLVSWLVLTPLMVLTQPAQAPNFRPLLRAN